MPRQIKRKEIEYHAPVQSVFHCLADCSEWTKLLLNRGKDYDSFITKLIDKNFYKELNERITIKRLSTDTDEKPAKITKWILQMYEDLFVLNDENPELFKQSGIKHGLYFKGIRSSAFFNLWLNTTPRVGESFSFFFIEAKIGLRAFYVTDVNHEFEDGEHRIVVWLNSGFYNSYRETLLDKALFYQDIGFAEALKHDDYEIDKTLKELYRR